MNKLNPILFLIILLSLLVNIFYIPIYSSGTELDILDHPRTERDKKTAFGDWISYRITQNLITIGDGIIDDDWDPILEFFVHEYTGTTTQGWVKSVHDDFYIYALIAYPLEAKWIAIELNATDNAETSMEINNDGWVFGEGTNIPNGELNPIAWEGDVHFIGNNDHPVKDERNDLTYEYLVDENTEMQYVEIRRPLNTQDYNGSDFTFLENTTFNVKFASSISPQYHKDGGISYLMNITPETIGQSTDNISSSTSTRRSPIEIKADNEFQLVFLSSLGLFINFTLISLIIIFYRKK